ncbi:MAG TPA: 4Fe-4S binding protein [Candidatus Omnitrophota bacterium]|nr:4Fe-4S binding protein [Candidatus Omnitrophota bacterium]HPN56816.1 4Fe-4S binding protein [Candidatus Omnitrophota bacterium]
MAVNVDINKCDGCGTCKDICPVDAIKVENSKASISDACIECCACVNECPSEALSLPT